MANHYYSLFAMSDLPHNICSIHIIICNIGYSIFLSYIFKYIFHSYIVVRTSKYVNSNLDKYPPTR